ncbi:MAG: hypothetical protein WA240_02025 [Nitrospirota bacterium]
MSDPLIDPFDFQDAPYALQTYYCYVRAWVEKITKLYGQSTTCLDNIKDEMMKLKTIQKIQGGRALDKDIVAAYTRGKLTLKAMETFPIKDNKDLAATANLWLPVQAYYAVHGVGLATMIALGQESPKDHRAFRSVFSDISEKYLPKPFNAKCGNVPNNQQFVFVNLNTTIQNVKQQSNLSNPKYANIECSLGKCLSTTRRRLLDELFAKERRNKVRRGRKRRNLSSNAKQRIADKLHATTVTDFLYRMRVRSNYEEPDIHLYASDQQTDEAVRHYADLLFLTQAIVRSLSVIMLRKIGKQAMDSIESRFTQ